MAQDRIGTHTQYLVEQVIQALIQVLQVQQDHSATSLHAYLDLVDIAAHLRAGHAQPHTSTCTIAH